MPASKIERPAYLSDSSKESHVKQPTGNASPQRDHAAVVTAQALHLLLNAFFIVDAGMACF